MPWLIPRHDRQFCQFVLQKRQLKIHKILRLQRRQLVPATDDCQEAAKNMLKLRSIGIRDYSVLEGRASVGFALPTNGCRPSGSGTLWFI